MHFFSLHLWQGRYRDFLEILENPTKPTLVFTPNPEILVKAASDGDFLETLGKADYLVPDANGLYVGQMIAEGTGFLEACFRVFFRKGEVVDTYGELIKGSNLTQDLVTHAIAAHQKVLMIDNYRIETPENPFEVQKKEIQGKLRDIFHEKFPDLDIDIVFDREKSPEDLARIIRESDIRYVFSCIGMKAQEERLVEIFAHLPKDQRVVGLGVGSSFDYLLGLQRRAPLIVQNLGLEWLYRLIMSPSRWRRISTALIEFPRRVRTYERS